MENDYVMEKVGWVTKRPTIPPLSKEGQELLYNQQTRFFENYVRFLQENGLTTRTIFQEGDKADDDSEIRVSDLTPEGFEFFRYGIIRWRQKLDSAKDKEKALSDIKFISKKLEDFKAQQEDTRKVEESLSQNKTDEARTMVASVLECNPLYGPAKELLANINAVRTTKSVHSR